MTCGISGSGKSTRSHNILTSYPTFTRLSIDTIILEKHGVYNIDYPSSSYSFFQEEAHSLVISQLEEILRVGKEDVVLDLAFYKKEQRDRFRGIVRREGGGRYGVLLVVFRVEGGDRGRVEGRRVDIKRAVRESGERVGGVVVSREVLSGFVGGFEWPGGEGEVVLWVE
jgi:predicted kinase